MSLPAQLASPSAPPASRSPAPAPSRRRRDERGEGVISAAIAVLVMAFIGVGMWVAFNATFNNAAKTINNQVNCIGSTNAGTSC
jgi:ferric-dicitrate binding protein FerR (iron transport regulator)